MSYRRGTSHYRPEQESSRGRSRDRLMDFNNGRIQYHDQRNAYSNEMRRRNDGDGYNYRSDRSYNYEHHRAHAPQHSQSWDPHSSRYPSSSRDECNNYSSYRRKRSRSPDSNNNRNSYHDEGFNQSKRHRSIGEAPQFNKINTIPELIQTACSSLSAMNPSNTAAFWNSLAKQLGRNNQLNMSIEQMDSQIIQLFEHTRRTLKDFRSKDLSTRAYA